MRKFSIILLILSSCSSQFHLKRAIKKDPSILTVDTLRVVDVDTFVTETIKHDTSFYQSHDTTIIVKDRMTIKHFIHDSVVYIEGECLGDTIIQTEIIEKPVEKVVYNERFFPNWFWVLFPVLIILYFLKRLKVL